jgi:tetratricopeptide (TPR) repeat protein
MARFEKLELESALSRSPDRDARKKPAQESVPWLEQAVEARSCGQYENALRMYSRALEDDKTLVVAWLGQVQMLVLLEESVEAELWSRKALEIFPGNGDLLAGRAQGLRRNGNSAQAMSLSDASLKATGQSAFRWLVRGELMAATKKDTDRHCFDKAVLADGGWIVLLEIARVYLELGMPGRAMDRIRRAVELSPDRYFAWFVQGQTQQELGFEDAARKSWQRCLELCPNHAEAEQNLRAFNQSGWSFRRIWRRVFGNHS